MVYGIAAANVEKVTVSGEPGSRTVTPSNRSRAYLVVYDGLLQDETLEVTAHELAVRQAA